MTFLDHGVRELRETAVSVDEDAIVARKVVERVSTSYCNAYKTRVNSSFVCIRNRLSYIEGISSIFVGILRGVDTYIYDGFSIYVCK